MDAYDLRRAVCVMHTSIVQAQLCVRGGTVAMDPGGSAIEAIDGDISAVADATTPSDGLSSATPPDVPQRNPDIGDTDPEPAAHSPGDGAVTVEVASIPVAIPVAGPHDVTLAAGQAIDKMAEDILGREEQAELEQELAELEVEVQADLQTQLEHAQAKIQAVRCSSPATRAVFGCVSGC